MRTKLFALLALLVVLAMVVVACAPAAPTEAPAADQPTAASEQPAATTEQPSAPAASGDATAGTKVGFVYVAPVGDMGWTWAHDQARQALEKDLGVETTYVENVPEGPDAERVIRDLAQKGYNPIFTTSFGFMDPTINVASEFPDTNFVHISGYKTADNVSTVFGGIEEARYLSGLVAGSMTESNILGYVAAFPIPEVIRGINAFAQGAREVNPDAEVRVVWTNTWFDPQVEREAAEALLDGGADRFIRRGHCFGRLILHLDDEEGRDEESRRINQKGGLVTPKAGDQSTQSGTDGQHRRPGDGTDGIGRAQLVLRHDIGQERVAGGEEETTCTQLQPRQHIQ